MKRPCREVGMARKFGKFSDKGTEGKERHRMGGFFNYCFELSNPMAKQLN